MVARTRQRLLRLRILRTRASRSGNSWLAYGGGGTKWTSEGQTCSHSAEARPPILRIGAPLTRVSRYHCNTLARIHDLCAVSRPAVPELDKTADEHACIR